MVKIIMEFDDEDDAKLAMNAYNWKQSVIDLDNLLRETTKRDTYQSRTPSEDEYNMAHYLREKLSEIVSDNNLTL
jgi:hypothetical protein